MSKVIGVTPGPVKHEIMEQSDVKQFTPTNTGSNGQVLKKATNGYKWANETVYRNPFGLSTISISSTNLTFESVPNDDYLNAKVQYSVYIGEDKVVDSAISNFLVPPVLLESDRATYSTNATLFESITVTEPSTNVGTYYINGAVNIDIAVLATTEGEVTTITGTGTVSGFAIYHNANNSSVLSIDVESVTLV